MEKIVGLLLSLILIFSMAGCKSNGENSDEDRSTKTIIELNENNYWKYITVKGTSAGVLAMYEINGVLEFALYEDVVFEFDVIYYTDGQPEEDYKSYTMLIACNASGDASFTTLSSGVTNVTIGKWLGIKEGELVSLENYKWKIHFKSVSGNVIYSL